MNKKLLLTLLLSVTVILFQAIAQAQGPGAGGHDEKATNLKVLPKNTSMEDIHNIMKGYSRSLGVRCGYCHAMKEGDAKKLDFASDAKPEKETARKMMKMEIAINKKYVNKINKDFESITCVTCHMGNAKPMVSVDSLPKKDMRPGK